MAVENNKDQTLTNLTKGGIAVVSPPNSLCLFDMWQHSTDSLAAIGNHMFWLGVWPPNLRFPCGVSDPHRTQRVIGLQVYLPEWHVNGWLRPRTVNLFLLLTVCDRTQTVEAARADAEKIRLLGGAEASAIEAVGKAEAERMRLKASAYKQYGEAAMLSLVLESLPKVIYCHPLSSVFTVKAPCEWKSWYRSFYFLIETQKNIAQH